MKPTNAYHQIRHKMTKHNWANTTQMGEEVRVQNPRVGNVSIFAESGQLVQVTVEPGSHFDNIPTTTDTLYISSGEHRYQLRETGSYDGDQRVLAREERPVGSDTWESVMNLEL